MNAYRPAPLRPPAWRPPAGLARPVVMAQDVVTTPVAPVAIPEGLIWTALAGAAAYAGIRTGMRESGLASVAGWAGGIAAGLAALIGLTGILAPTAARGFPIRWYFVS